MVPKADRRHFRRVHADVRVRTVGMAPRQVGDISEGGVRVYADEEQRVGTRLQIELAFADGGTLVCSADVVWVEELFADEPAQFEMGLQFVDLPQADHDRITKVVEDDEKA
jgi:hypothetical protein